MKVCNFVSSIAVAIHVVMTSPRHSSLDSVNIIVWGTIFFVALLVAAKLVQLIFSLSLFK